MTANSIQVHIGEICPDCGGTGKRMLPPGQFSGSGQDFLRCPGCQQTPGHTERRWISLDDLRTLLAEAKPPA
jgi:hypothetical protein